MWSALPPRLSYRARLLVGGLPCLALELLLVALPLHRLQQLPPQATRLGVYAGLVALGLGLLVQALVLWRWLRPIDQALRLKAAGEPLSAAQADAVYCAILRVPARVVWLRAASWTLGVLGVAVALHYRTGMPTSGLFVFMVVGALHPLGGEVFRSSWYARVLLDVRADLLPNVDPLRLFADSYFARLVRGSLIPGLLGAAGVGAFVWLFVRVSLEQYRVLQTYFPFTVLGLTVLWYLVMLRARRPLDAYLGAALDKGTDLPRPAAVEEAIPAYRAAQALPYRLAFLKLSSWILALLLLCLEGVLLFDVDVETVVLISGTGAFAAIGVALSEALAHREVLKPLLAHLAARHRLSIDAVSSPVTLRAKMLAAFLGLTVFACGLSFFWSFVEYKRLASDFIKKQSDLKLDWVISDVERRASRPGHEPPERLAEKALRVIAGQDEGANVYFVPAGTRRETLALGPGLKPAPPLPRMVRARFARNHRGSLEVNELRLTGTFRTLRSGDRDIGILVTLYPGYHSRGPGIAGSLRAPFVFFLVLFALSAVVVLRVVRELTMPIHALEERASEMARGELGRPVYGIGEADELGRLTYAFEEMRRELNRKLRSTESLTIDLEREVARRTEDLERSNRELRDALIQLRRAQAELVRSEKMASIGQLVAGIAHEINNPVNAIANTISPLEETVQTAVGGTGAAKEAAVTDLTEMLRVIQRGARRTKEIVQALHNYARGDADRLVEVDLHRGLDDSLDLLRHHLKGIEVERAYGAVGRVRGFAGQLHQVFMNLLTNAAQAIRLSGKGGKIRITTSARGAAVIIAITDDGPGIPDHLLARIFDPFFTTKDVGEGSGLGLSIVHGIVERHNGSISVASEVGKGTTFTVVLPQSGPTVVAPPGNGDSGTGAAGHAAGA
ncbi:MAG: HAMP domain-containing protein [Deltaproteobacteria bacterium]|nr:HAMP domain-containing protein [Deltaproteobacteria bacterium]